MRRNMARRLKKSLMAAFYAVLLFPGATNAHRLEGADNNSEAKPSQSSVCDLALDYGKCDGGKSNLAKRYYYNEGYGECLYFTWYGCEGVDPSGANNFATKGECEALCVNRTTTTVATNQPAVVDENSSVAAAHNWQDEDLQRPFSPTSTVSAITNSSSASSSKYCADRRSAENAISQLVDRYIMPLRKSSERLASLCERGEGIDGDAMAHQLRTLVGELNSTLSTKFVPFMALALNPRRGADANVKLGADVNAAKCELCRQGVKSMRMKIDEARDQAETLIFNPCIQSVDSAQLCATFSDKFVAPLQELVYDFLDEEILCKVVFKTCVLTDEDREKYELHESRQSKKMVWSCALCETLLSKAYKQIPRLKTTIDTIGDFVCSKQRAENQPGCREKTISAVDLASGIGNQIVDYLRPYTCGALDCWKPNDVSNPTKCYDGDPAVNRWFECKPLKCKVRPDSDGRERWMICMHGEGENNGLSCQEDGTGAEEMCSLLQCNPSSATHGMFLCAQPPATCFTDNARNQGGKDLVQNHVWRTCPLGVDCYTAPKLYQQCLDLHGPIKTDRCKTAPNQQGTTQCTHGMFCVDQWIAAGAGVERKKMGFYCKTNW